jgi:L-ascorbate metabolism protein UlaG (beta-lactamase superfamily)
MNLTWYGHSCFLLDIGGSQLLFDPFITPNAKAEHISIDTLNPDYILLSHGHADHVADAEVIARKSGAMLVSNYEIVTWYQDKGIERVWPLNHGGQHRFDFGTVRYVNAVHSSVLPDGTYGGNPGGFIVSADEARVYYAGDTALHTDMELIGRHWRPDLAILPIGDNFTMGIDDALLCADMIQCKRVVGMHYGTFPYIEIDINEALQKFNASGIELILFSIGETKQL